MASENPLFNDSLYYTSAALSRMLTRIAEDRFRKTGLSPSHAYLLMTVLNRPGIQPGEISEELHLAPSTVTRLVEKLETGGYLLRITEGRATMIEPTGRARTIKSELEEVRQELQKHYASKLGDRYTRVLTEMTLKALEQLK